MPITINRYRLPAIILERQTFAINAQYHNIIIIFRHILMSRDAFMNNIGRDDPCDISTVSADFSGKSMKCTR